MADVRVKFVGKAPIVVNGLTWFEGEIHTINEKLARSLLAFGEQVVVLPPLGGGGLVVEEPLPSPPQIGEGAVDGGDGGDGVDVVVEEKPVRRKRK